MTRLFLLLSALLLIVSCKKDEQLSESEQFAKDIGLIKQYLTDHNLTATETPSGLHYVVMTEGKGGSKPVLSSQVEVQYTGYFTDGKVFDGTKGNNTIRFKLTDVISGWTEGLQLMTRGQKNMLLLPSKLGYGSRPPAGIPANAVLIFEVVLVDFS